MGTSLWVEVYLQCILINIFDGKENVFCVTVTDGRRSSDNDNDVVESEKANQVSLLYKIESFWNGFEEIDFINK